MYTIRRRLFVVILPMLLTTAAAGHAQAADIPIERQPGPVAAEPVTDCGPREVVLLVDERGYPTVPARTPYRYCVTGPPLLPGRGIPPPPEYCCH